MSSLTLPSSSLLLLYLFFTLFDVFSFGQPLNLPPSSVHHKHELLEFIESAQPISRHDRDWTSTDLKQWIAKGDLATAFSTPPITSLHFPVYINVFPIGFGTQGNLALNLSTGQLSAWFQHLDHIVPQGLIRGEELNAENFNNINNRDEKRENFKEDEVHISYRYHARLIELSPRVSLVLERYLDRHWRLQSNEDETRQVDAEVMAALLEDLIQHLGLTDAYNIMVLNPKLPFASSAPAASYGYRVGFSNFEIDTILETTDESIRKIMNDFMQSRAGRYEEKYDVADVSLPALDAAAPPVAPRLQIVDLLSTSQAWADGLLAAPYLSGPKSLKEYIKDLASQHPEILRHTIGNKYAQEDCLVDTWLSTSRSLFIDLSAGPFTWGPIVGGEGVRHNASLPSVRTFVSRRLAEQSEEKNDDTYSDAHYDADTITAEKLVLADMMMSKGCYDDSAPDECKALVHQFQELEAWEKEHEHRLTADSDAPLPPKPTKQPELDSFEALSFFSDENTKTGHDESIETDHFLSHLSSVLSASLHHVFTPSVADTHITGGYAKHVAFHLYVLANHEAYDPMEHDFFGRFRAGVEQFKLPSQTFSYVAHKLTMSSDPTLALAYSNCLRTTVVPSLLYDGHFAAIKRLYLDSLCLQAELTKMDQQGKFEHKMEQKDMREVSIFMFSVDFPLPVLIDKHFQSQALPGSNMVIGIQSNLHLWESPISCNGKPIHWNLRDPSRSLLSSVSHVLGGLLPPHLSSSSARLKPDQDWRWSVGASPLAATSYAGTRWSQVQIDTIHRNYIVTAVRRAVTRMNDAIEELQNQSTASFNRMLGGIDDIPLNSNSSTASPTAAPPGKYFSRTLQIRDAYMSVTNTIQSMTDTIDRLAFDEGCQLIPRLYEQANQFSTLVRGVIDWNKRERCVSPSTSSSPSTPSGSSSFFTLSYHYYLGAVMIGLGIVIFRILGNAQYKPKLN